jgi:ABC-type multidrug transport system ATPase subunit
MKRVRNLLLKIHQNGKNVIVIEQRVKLFLQDSTRYIIAEQGKIRFEGNSDDLREVIAEKHLVAKYPPRIRNDHLIDNEIILKVKNISYFIAEKEILKNISFEIKRGETIAIVGENGSGKTTLIKHFNSLLHPNGGEIFIAEEKVGSKIPMISFSKIALKMKSWWDQSSWERKKTAGLKRCVTSWIFMPFLRDPLTGSVRGKRSALPLLRYWLWSLKFLF